MRIVRKYSITTLEQKKVFAILLIVALMLALFAPVVSAEEKADAQDGWEFQVAPYLWGIALNGDVTVKGQKSDVDASFSDIWDELNFGGMLAFEGRKGKWGFWGDTVYANLGNSTTVGPLQVDPDINVLWLTLGGSYRLGTWPLSAAPGKEAPAVTVDMLAGARYTYLDVKLDIESLPNREADKSWVDPLVGARVHFDLSEHWTLSLAGSVGGFGVGSDFAWHAYGGFGYRFRLFSKQNNARVVAGYRALYQDYSDGSGDDKFAWDVMVYGPTLGLIIAF
jgi:hypothetical protein